MIKTKTLSNRYFLSLAIFIVIACVSQFSQAQCTIPCSLIWSDEFDGTSLDTTNWEYQYGDGTGYGITGWGNNELQYYTDTQTIVSGGLLTIRAEELPTGTQVGGKDYISSRIRSIGKHDTAYGRYEVRVKLPANQGTTGQGTWPAVWLLNSYPTGYGNWPSSGEIDIMEWLGNDADQIYGTLHYGNVGGPSANNGNDFFLSAGTTNDFHVYAVEWDVNQIRWYVDGILYHTVNSSTWFSGGSAAVTAPFDVPFHFIMNVAVGGNFPGNPNGNSIFPQDLVIDYARHYAFSATPVIDGTPAAPQFLFDDFEDNDPFDWFTFGSGIGGGGIGNNVSNTPSPDGGDWAMDSGWGSGGTPGFLGGFGYVRFANLHEMTKFSFWINPDVVSNDFGSGPVNQDYNLEINIQDDDTGDGQWIPTEDDEFQFICRVSPTGPCAITGGGWQKVEIPIEDFVHDTSFASGGTGVLDTAPGENGVMQNMTVAVISNTGADVNFDTDHWLFEGEAAAPEPELPSETIPLPLWFITLLGISLVLIAKIRK